MSVTLTPRPPAPVIHAFSLPTVREIPPVLPPAPSTRPGDQTAGRQARGQSSPPTTIPLQRPHGPAARARRRQASGIAASTSVPPSAGLSTRRRPSSDGEPVAEPDDAAAVEPGTADAVVADVEDERALLDVRARPRRARLARAWRRWSAPRRRRSTRSPRPRRAAARRTTSLSTGTGIREASASTPARSPPCVSADGRMPCASSRSSAFASLRVSSASLDVARAPRRRRCSSAWRASFSVITVWTRRCCAPSCRSRTTRRRSSSAAATIRARDAASSDARLDVRDRGGDQLGELADPRLGPGRQRLGAPRGRDRSRPTAARRRRSGCRPRSGCPPRALRRRSRRWPSRSRRRGRAGRFDERARPTFSPVHRQRSPTERVVG